MPTICEPERGRVTLTHQAAKWGFSDLSHLHRAFRHHLGQTPREVLATDDLAQQRAG